MKYEWKITQLDCFTQKDGSSNVVLNVHWRRTADDGIGHTSEMHGLHTLKYNTENTFIPYDNLTHDQICLWLETDFNNEIVNPEIPDPHQEPDPNYTPVTKMDSIDATLNWLISQQITPPVITPSLPWTAAQPEIVPPMLPNVVLHLVEAPVASIEPAD